LYSIDAGRHVDTPNLFHPDVKNPSDGLFVLAHNFVNGFFGKKNSFQHGDKPKCFCISTSPKMNVSGCNHTEGDPSLNLHYENIRAGDLFVVAKDAAYFTPHKAEDCNEGWTSLTMSRNYTTSINKQ